MTTAPAAALVIVKSPQGFHVIVDLRDGTGTGHGPYTTREEAMAQRVRIAERLATMFAEGGEPVELQMQPFTGEPEPEDS